MICEYGTWFLISVCLPSLHLYLGLDITQQTKIPHGFTISGDSVSITQQIGQFCDISCLTYENFLWWSQVEKPWYRFWFPHATVWILICMMCEHPRTEFFSVWDYVEHLHACCMMYMLYHLQCPLYIRMLFRDKGKTEWIIVLRYAVSFFHADSVLCLLTSFQILHCIGICIPMSIWPSCFQDRKTEIVTGLQLWLMVNSLTETGRLRGLVGQKHLMLRTDHLQVY